MMSARNKLAIVMGAGAAALAIQFTGGNEGLRMTTYWDKIANIWSYCYGETSNAQPGKTYTREYCDDQLAAGLLARYQAMQKCYPGLDALTPGEKVAYLDLAYNAGTGTFCNRPIAAPFPQLLAQGKRVEACKQLERFSYSRGNWIQGLFNRRIRAENLCLRDLPKT